MVVEPHSFDVEVVAVENGKRHVWKFANPEGRSRISAAAAKDGGIEIETVGPAVISDVREVEGVVQLGNIGALGNPRTIPGQSHVGHQSRRRLCQKRPVAGAH